MYAKESKSKAKDFLEQNEKDLKEYSTKRIEIKYNKPKKVTKASKFLNSPRKTSQYFTTVHEEAGENLPSISPAPL